MSLLNRLVSLAFGFVLMSAGAHAQQEIKFGHPRHVPALGGGDHPGRPETPPVASVLMAACAIAKSGVWETSRVNLPFISALLVVLILCTYVPALSLTLVDLFYGG